MGIAVRKLGAWGGPDGGATFEIPAPRVVLVTMRGRIDEATGREVAEALRETLKFAPPKNTFWDLFEMESYHTAVRTMTTQAILEHWDNVAGIQVIARARIVKMGVAVANVALHGRVQSFDKRNVFDSALIAACKT